MAWLCVPLILAPPMAMLGQYGITLPEMIVLATGLFMMATYTVPRVGVPAFLMLYIAGYAVGWVGALYNSFDKGIPIGPGHLSVGYVFALTVSGYVIGRYSRIGIDEIMTSRLTFWIVAFVFVVAVAYPFLTADMRQRILAPFINEEFTRRLAAPRFPGMGINANTYSFMVYVVFLFGFAAFLARRGSAFVPFATFIIILAAASRTITALALGSAAVLIGASMLTGSRARREWTLYASKLSRRRAFLVVVTVLAVGVPLVVVYGSKANQVFTLYSRFEELIAGNEESGLANRQGLWALGIARIRLAPVLGLPKDVTRPENDTNPLYYYSPHNEFIYFWGTFGILTMLAHVYLILHLIAVNLRARSGVIWLLLYGALVVQMTFDAVFQGPRVVAFFFMIIGLNIRFISDLAERRRAVRAPASAPVTT
jgi:hypothetical protein